MGNDPENIYGTGQGARPEKERELPDYARSELDLARSGFDNFGYKASPEYTASVFAKWGIER